MRIARSLVFYLAFYGGTILLLVQALFTLPVSPNAMIKIARNWSLFHRWCLRHLAGIEIRETGQRTAQAALYAFKHESFFEAIDLPASLNNPAIFAKEELFDIPGWGKAAEAYGAIPVARSDGAGALRRMLSSAKTHASAGRSLAIFPEGTRIRHGERAALKPGFAGLYKVLGLPVVPVAVNSGPLYHCAWKRPGTITLHFGEPIEPGLPRDEIERRVLEAINALNR